MMFQSYNPHDYLQVSYQQIAWFGTSGRQHVVIAKIRFLIKARSYNINQHSRNAIFSINCSLQSFHLAIDETFPS